jgi:hypothetical protein
LIKEDENKVALKPLPSLSDNFNFLKYVVKRKNARELREKASVTPKNRYRLISQRLQSKRDMAMPYLVNIYTYRLRIIVNKAEGNDRNSLNTGS